MLALVITISVALSAAVAFYPPAGKLISLCVSGARDFLQTAPGFIESFSLIFMTELGDKTFFIAALLAIRFGKAISFFGGTLALGVMSAISVGIGRVFLSIPQFVDQGANVGQYIGAALLFYFGAPPSSSQCTVFRDCFPCLQPDLKHIHRCTCRVDGTVVSCSDWRLL